jgi:hypothetical protein
MPAKKQPISSVSERRAFRFYKSILGHVVLALIIWIIGFNLLILAIDTGSLLQWGGVFVSLFWGLYHLLQSTQMFIKKLWQKTSKKA